jgi:GntR family transcriptional regulator
MRASGKHLSDLQLDPASKVPVYQQIMRQVRHLGYSGRLRPGHQLPTVRELAVQLGVNFNTVARAYRLLQGTGVLYAQQGRGTFFAARASARQRQGALLRTLTIDFIAQARQHGFTRARIAAAFNRQLRQDARRTSRGGQ